MSTHGVNQTSTQPTPPPQQNDANQQSRNVSDKQANDFADRMAKEKRGKEKKTGGDKEQSLESLESLLAERNKNSKNAIRGRQEKGSREGSQEEKGSENMFQNARDGSEHVMVNNAQNPIKADTQLREIQQTSSVKEVDTALQKMADQIQVSAKDAVNGAEVRISLKDNVLPGTEIRIQRHGGELTVTMNTTSAEAGNFLAQHEANLQKMLAERFSNDKVQVNINMSGGDNQDSDGRSRNQYAAEDDNDQNSPRNDRA